MVTLLSLARKPQYQRIERAKRKALEPRDFCNIWIEKLYGIKPDERGFKAACIKELAKITGTGYATIERNWGADFSDRPSWVLTFHGILQAGQKKMSVINNFSSLSPLSPLSPLSLHLRVSELPVKSKLLGAAPPQTRTHAQPHPRGGKSLPRRPGRAGSRYIN